MNGSDPLNLDACALDLETHITTEISICLSLVALACGQRIWGFGYMGCLWERHREGSLREDHCQDAHFAMRAVCGSIREPSKSKRNR